MIKKYLGQVTQTPSNWTGVPAPPGWSMTGLPWPPMGDFPNIPKPSPCAFTPTIWPCNTEWLMSPPYGPKDPPPGWPAGWPWPLPTPPIPGGALPVPPSGPTPAPPPTKPVQTASSSDNTPLVLGAFVLLVGAIFLVLR